MDNEKNSDNNSKQFLARKLIQQPTIENAQIFKLNNASNFSHQLQLILTQPDYVKNKTLRHTKNFLVDEKLEQVIELGMGPPLGGCAGYYYSPSGKKAIAFKESNGGKDSAEPQIFDIIIEGGVISKQITVPESIHGGVCQDAMFGQISWNSDETKIVYAAQIPKQKGSKILEGQSDEKKSGEKGYKGVPDWKDDWGERYTGMQEPGIFVLDLESSNIQRIAGEIQGSLGSPIFTPDDKGVVFVRWPASSVPTVPLDMKLGLIYCANRQSQLYCIQLDDKINSNKDDSNNNDGKDDDGDDSNEIEAICLTTSLKSATQPRFSPDGKKLLFLSNDRACTSGTHLSSVEIMRIDWGNEKAREKIKKVFTEGSLCEEFPGLFCTGWSQTPFIDNSRVILSTQIRSDSAIVSIDIDNGKVVRLTPKNSSFGLLKFTKEGHVFASASSPNQVRQLAISKLQISADNVESGAWKYFALQTQQIPELKELKYEVVDINSEDHPIQIILLYKEGSTGGKGVLGIHGGPHSATPTIFMEMGSYLATQGYCVAYVNYRGSWGYGAEALECLAGHAGTMDVKDCMTALQWCIDNKYMDADKCGVMGGSHGGFLTGHLMGQHPQAFKCGVLRNPVCDLSLMIHVTDIPDWCYIEAFGINTQLRYPPSTEDFARLFEVSPIAHIKNVVRPMMFMLGKADRRVPWVDSQRYIQVLRGLGNLKEEDVKVVAFDEDCHALDKPKTVMQQFVDISDWFENYCS